MEETTNDGSCAIDFLLQPIKEKYIQQQDERERVLKNGLSATIQSYKKSVSSPNSCCSERCLWKRVF
jgi:hypothetical protein